MPLHLLTFLRMSRIQDAAELAKVSTRIMMNHGTVMHSLDIDVIKQAARGCLLTDLGLEAGIHVPLFCGALCLYAILEDFISDFT